MRVKNLEIIYSITHWTAFLSYHSWQFTIVLGQMWCDSCLNHLLKPQSVSESNHILQIACDGKLKSTTISEMWFLWTFLTVITCKQSRPCHYLRQGVCLRQCGTTGRKSLPYLGSNRAPTSLESCHSTAFHVQTSLWNPHSPELCLLLHGSRGCTTASRSTRMSLFPQVANRWGNVHIILCHHCIIFFLWVWVWVWLMYGKELSFSP